VLYTKCIKNIYKGVMRPIHAESFDVTAAGRSVDPAAVPRWYKLVPPLREVLIAPPYDFLLVMPRDL
jgi:hypothetical protein